MKPAHPANRANRELTRVSLSGEELERLASRVLDHFLRHKPEPASFPAMASRIIDLAEHPDVDASKLAHQIERDPALCGAVLAVANSAANRRPMPVQSVRTAISLLGIKQVANIAVGVACRSLFDVEVRVQHELFPRCWERLFHASMTEAFTLSFVAMERLRGAAEGIFLAGMLHNIGKPLALSSLASLVLAGEISGLPDEDSIEEVLRMTRVEIGVQALTTFNMPEHLISLCAKQADDDVPEGPKWLDLHLLRVITALNDLRLNTLHTAEPLRLLANSAKALGMSGEEILAIAGRVVEHAAQVTLLFSTNDDADESGYLEFVGRCLAESAPDPSRAMMAPKRGL